MHIMTERGWRPLQTAPCAPIAVAPPRYDGPLPSLTALAHIAELDSAHDEWVARRKELKGDR